MVETRHPDPVIRVDGLTKTYSRSAHPAVDDLSIEVSAASVFAFLGRNGAGKSTTIGCINTTLDFESGRIEIAGHVRGRDDDAIRREIGVVFQNSVLDPLLTAGENLRMRSRLYGAPSAVAGRVDDLVELVGIGSFIDQRYGKLSGGQKRRVDIARALAHNPRILMLDEPTAGLDPASREQVWQTISAMREEYGLTVFLTTHYMEETERADSVCIIDRGRIVAEGTPAQLRARYSSSILSLEVADAARLREACAAVGARAASGQGDRYTVAVSDSAQAQRILGVLGDAVLDFEFRHGTMDDVFLSLTETEGAEA